jgi:Lrp/AsnC family transcriptional regulator, leucine-responsive regulatory protein
MTMIDAINERILRELTRNGRISNIDLAARVGLSASVARHHSWQ